MILVRDNIVFQCKLPRGGKLWGKGSFHLTSKRLVFVATSGSSRADFKSFEVPLVTMERPKFQQPIFGANYLEGVAVPEDPSLDSPLAAGGAYFSLTFNSGGCGTFLPIFYRLLGEIWEQGDSTNRIADAAIQGRLNDVAYVDPSDPSVLYLSQPTTAAGSEETTPFVDNEPSAPPASNARGGQQGNQECVCS